MGSTMTLGFFYKPNKLIYKGYSLSIVISSLTLWKVTIVPNIFERTLFIYILAEIIETSLLYKVLDVSENSSLEGVRKCISLICITHYAEIQITFMEIKSRG